MTDPSDWTDERIAARLSRTFAEHEADADQALARRIAGTTPATRHRSRRTWPAVLGAAAVVVLVAATSAVLVVRADPADPQPGSATTAPGSPPPTGSTSPTSAPVSRAGENRSLAAARAAHVLATMPVPPGARRSATPTAGSLLHRTCICGRVDPTLTCSQW